jgi:hypothetical protein
MELEFSEVRRRAAHWAALRLTVWVLAKTLKK